jgi:hypothetical protein
MLTTIHRAVLFIERICVYVGKTSETGFEQILQRTLPIHRYLREQIFVTTYFTHLCNAYYTTNYFRILDI